MHTRPRVDVRGVGKSYMTRSGGVDAVRDVSFSVSDGEFVALVGPSGCGKSTILKMVAGLVSYDLGEIEVAGAKARAGRSEVGMMLQAPVLFPWRTVRQNVLLPLEVFGKDMNAGRRRAEEIIQLVGLAGFEEKYPWELSGGMQQRVNLSRLLVFEPSILLMDEPFASLDEFTRERLNLEIASLHERFHRSVIFVTHNIPEAVFLSDRVLVMSPRPGTIAGEVTSTLPRPRVASLIDSEPMVKTVRAVRALLSTE
jgi:NitT/TauT family transport system ATP-binding protein